jgi:hypothetical protein
MRRRMEGNAARMAHRSPGPLTLFEHHKLFLLFDLQLKSKGPNQFLVLAPWSP